LATVAAGVAADGLDLAGFFGCFAALDCFAVEIDGAASLPEGIATPESAAKTPIENVPMIRVARSLFMVMAFQLSVELGNFSGPPE
jgi:hypothetical protein